MNLMRYSENCGPGNEAPTQTTPSGRKLLRRLHPPHNPHPKLLRLVSPNLAALLLKPVNRNPLPQNQPLNSLVRQNLAWTTLKEFLFLAKSTLSKSALSLVLPIE
jgi:hypothetical protein